MTLKYEFENFEEVKKEVSDLTELAVQLQNQLADLKQAAQFLTVEDVSKLTGIGIPKVREIFNRPDFPYTDYGKSKVIMLKAFIEYFMKPVKQSDFE